MATLTPSATTKSLPLTLELESQRTNSENFRFKFTVRTPDLSVPFDQEEFIGSTNEASYLVPPNSKNEWQLSASINRSTTFKVQLLFNSRDKFERTCSLTLATNQTIKTLSELRVIISHQGIPSEFKTQLSFHYNFASASRAMHKTLKTSSTTTTNTYGTTGSEQHHLGTTVSFTESVTSEADASSTTQTLSNTTQFLPNPSSSSGSGGGSADPGASSSSAHLHPIDISNSPQQSDEDSADYNDWKHKHSAVDFAWNSGDEGAESDEGSENHEGADSKRVRFDTDNPV